MTAAGLSRPLRWSAGGSAFEVSDDFPGRAEDGGADRLRQAGRGRLPAERPEQVVCCGLVLGT